MLLVSRVEMLQGGLVVSAKSGVKAPEFESSAYTQGFLCRSLSPEGAVSKACECPGLGKASGDSVRLPESRVQQP